MIKAKRRFTKRGKSALAGLAENHPALIEGRTLFPSTVRSASDREWTLKRGEHSTKLGSMVEKGEWRGFPIYSLNLEERKTCPSTCQQWANCYGNHMQMAARFRVDLHLYTRLCVELDALSELYLQGYAIRLHDLGDFASPEYLRFWFDAMRGHRALHIFGYTHWPRDTEIGAMIEQESAKWERFRIRFSDHHQGERTTHVIDGPAWGKHELGIVCPADDRHPERCCGNCGLCWNSTVPIVFQRH